LAVELAYGLGEDGAAEHTIAIEQAVPAMWRVERASAVADVRADQARRHTSGHDGKGLRPGGWENADRRLILDDLHGRVRCARRRVAPCARLRRPATSPSSTAFGAAAASRRNRFPHLL
jgi:hypothetical protein